MQRISVLSLAGPREQGGLHCGMTLSNIAKTIEAVMPA